MGLTVCVPVLGYEVLSEGSPGPLVFDTRPGWRRREAAIGFSGVPCYARYLKFTWVVESDWGVLVFSYKQQEHVSFAVRANSSHRPRVDDTRDTHHLHNIKRWDRFKQAHVFVLPSYRVLDTSTQKATHIRTYGT